MLAYVERII